MTHERAKNVNFSISIVVRLLMIYYINKIKEIYSYSVKWKQTNHGNLILNLIFLVICNPHKGKRCQLSQFSVMTKAVSLRVLLFLMNSKISNKRIKNLNIDIKDH